MDLNEELFRSVEALTFDDVLIVPGYSEMLPSEVDVRAHLTQEIIIGIPILSAAMDTVTEARLAIALACAGGIGILHRNMSPEVQALEVDKVKQADMESGYPHAACNRKGRLLCGAAVGVGPDLEQRAGSLIEKGVDVLVVDTAHGHSKGVIQAIQRIHRNWPEMPVIAGNVVTTEGTKALIEAGAAAVKVGVGAGSICTTRVVAGAGMPQLSAIHACAQAAKPYNIPIIADGGIKFSGDIVKAIAAGADTVMLGSLMAGLEESPGEVVRIEDRQYKEYRGMGSLGAMQGYGKDRYGSGQGAGGKSVPEGIEGRIPYKGTLSEFIYQLIGGLRSGMGYAGARNLEDLRTKTKFVRITNAGLVESHPHDITITKEAPNYPLHDD